MSTQKQLQEGMQTFIRTITPAFASADVVINDWDLLDGPVAGAPYVIISNADEWAARKQTAAAQREWQIVATLYEEFKTGEKAWKTTMDNLRDRIEAILDKVDEGAYRTAGLAGTNISAVRSGGPVEARYQPYLTPEQLSGAMPIFVYQRMIFSVETF